MRAFRIEELAHPSSGKHGVVSDAPEPIAGEDEVLVDVYTAGLNFFDILQAQGKYQIQPPLPFTLGLEFAGRISADSPIPPGCHFKRGDRVFGSFFGAYAEKIHVPWKISTNRSLKHIPDGISYNEAAGAYPTMQLNQKGALGLMRCTFGLQSQY